MPASVFTQENFARLDLVIAQHKGEQGALMPVLYEAKKIFGFISIDIQERISKGLDIPLSEIYGVASFYSTFSDKQKGENIIAVCLGTACYVKGSQKIIDKISKKLNIEVPVSNAIYEAVYTDITPQALLEKLMNRKLKEEERYV